MNGPSRLLLQNLGTKVVLEGNFTDNMVPAVGKLLYPNGDVYYGQIREFLREGQGRMIYADGSSYEGGWLEDKKEG